MHEPFRVRTPVDIRRNDLYAVHFTARISRAERSGRKNERKTFSQKGLRARIKFNRHDLASPRIHLASAGNLPRHNLNLRICAFLPAHMSQRKVSPRLTRIARVEKIRKV